MWLFHAANLFRVARGSDILHDWGWQCGSAMFFHRSALLIITQCVCCRRFRASQCRTGDCRHTSGARSPGAAPLCRSAPPSRPRPDTSPATVTRCLSRHRHQRPPGLCSHPSPPRRVVAAALRAVPRTERDEPTGLCRRCRNESRRRPRSSRMHCRRGSRARRPAGVAAACSRCRLSLGHVQARHCEPSPPHKSGICEWPAVVLQPCVAATRCAVCQTADRGSTLLISQVCGVSVSYCCAGEVSPTIPPSWPPLQPGDQTLGNLPAGGPATSGCPPRHCSCAAPTHRRYTPILIWAPADGMFCAPVPDAAVH